MSDPFIIHLAVRDYECDLQGVVNNAVYQNYLEHARHEWLKAQGLDFAEFTRSGIHLVVVRAELDYRKSLTSGDNFRVETRLEKSGKIRFLFLQRIMRESDNSEMMHAVITATALNENGRPSLPESISKLLPP